MKKVSFFVFLSLFSSILLSTSNKNMTPSFASSEEASVIGTYFEAERVEETTKVYIPLSQISMVEEAGRTVYDSLHDIGTPEIMSTFLLNNRFYYYATPNDGRIIAKHILKNDLESVITALRIMHSEATAFINLSTNNLTISNRNNLILEYLRTLSGKYTGTLWNNVAGTFGNVVNTFHNFLIAFDTGGISLSEFFASFVEDTVNSSYTNIGEEFKNKHLYLINPISGYPDIDLIHLFASFDGCAENTGTLPAVFAVISRWSIASLSSWAGDLQSFAHSKKDENMDDFDIIDDAFNTNSSFSYEDLYADIDAFNMAISYDITISPGIYQIFENYYDTLTETERFYGFVFSLCGASSATQNTIEEEFIYLVYEMMLIDYNGPDEAPTSKPESFEIFDDDFEVIKYKLLGFEIKFFLNFIFYVSVDVPNFDKRLEISNQFIDFIFEKGGINYVMA